MQLTELQKSEIQRHAIEQHDSDRSECCGYVLEDGRVLRSINVAEDPTTDFIIDADSAVEANRVGFSHVYHSHTNGNSRFSHHDAISCKQLNKPFVLYDVHTNRFKILDPSDDAPYVGREFTWWLCDCYSLAQDYYRREFNIRLGDYDREVENNRLVGNAFAQNYTSEGFGLLDRSTPPQKGDLPLFAIGSNYPNHIGIIDRDGLFLHQLIDRPSEHAIWGGSWIDCCVGLLRHKDLNISRS